MTFSPANGLSAGHQKIRAAAKALLPLCAAFLLLAPLAVHNLADPNLWFDESGQFWMARGLNHFSAPLSADGSLYDVVQSNRRFNLDPGGFTLLLHYWLGVGNDPAWLRTLPLLFLAATLYFLILAADELTGSLPAAIAAAAVCLAPFDMVLSYGFELRPYSMEAAGVVAAFYFLIRAAGRPTPGNLWRLGLACSFFLTSRYSFVIAVAAVCPVLLLLAFRRSLRRFVTAGYGFYGPVACAALAVWLLSLSHQDPGGATPYYVRGFVLLGKSLPQILELVRVNLFSAQGLPYTVLVAALPLLGYARLERLTGVRQESLRAAWLFLVGFQAVSIALSALGKYPWRLDTRWNISLQALAVIAAMVLSALLAGYLRRRLPQRAGRWVKPLAVGILLVVAIGATDKKVHFSNDVLYSYLLSLGEPRLAQSQIFVGYFASPSVRYLFEYGPLKDRRDMYPGHFSFESREEFGRQGRLDADRFDVALLAVVDDPGVQKYLARFDHRFVLAKGQPLSYLLLKTP
jgi:Predicted membrane protein